MNNPNPFFPCGKCGLKVHDNHKAIQCDSCNFWTHIKCDGVNNSLYENLKKSNSTYYCKLCKELALPFQQLTDEQFFICQKGVNLEVDVNSSLQLFPNHKINSLFKEINNFNSNDNDEESSIDCKYYNADEIDNCFNNSGKFSLFHLNIASLGCHKEELEELLSIFDIKLDIIGISETKIIKDVNPTYDINLKGYNCFFTPTESNKGGTIIFFNENINAKQRNDLENKLYVSKMLESTFIEINNKGKKNIIIGCLYKHPSMDIDDFNSLFETTIEKISSENKDFYLLGDFNLDLLKIEEENKIEDFYNIISANLLVPHITIPTRITETSKTLIDNIFSNNFNFLNLKSGNITVSISDHMPQFLIVPNSVNRVCYKQKIFKRDTKNIDKENFIADIINIDWNPVLDIDKNDPNFSFNNFDKIICDTLDSYAPLKKQMKENSKPRITNGIRNSIIRRDRLLRKFIDCKTTERKKDLHLEYKSLRNEIVSRIRTCKKEHYQNYFAENFKDIRKTWKGIKSIINIHNITKGQPSSMIIDKELQTNPINIANGFKIITFLQ